MLHLRRMVQPFAWERCKISKEYILPGDYYYWDDEDGLVVKASVYHKLKWEKKVNEWDWASYYDGLSEREYEEMMREKEREYLTQGLLDRKVDKGGYS